MPEELEIIKEELKTLREDMDKMMTCSIIIKRLIEQVTGANIDELVKKEMKVN